MRISDWSADVCSSDLRCNVDDIAKPDTSRGAYIIDHSTETLLADRKLQSDGSYTSSTRAFSLPDRGSVPACDTVRSEERRVGKAWFSTCISRWSPDHDKKTQRHTTTILER